MNNAFNEMDDAAGKAPEHIKGMLVSEIDLIRDSLTVINVFMGQFMQTAVKMIQESQPTKG